MNNFFLFKFNISFFHQNLIEENDYKERVQNDPSSFRDKALQVQHRIQARLFRAAYWDLRLKRPFPPTHCIFAFKQKIILLSRASFASKLLTKILYFKFNTEFHYNIYAILIGPAACRPRRILARCPRVSKSGTVQVQACFKLLRT